MVGLVNRTLLLALIILSLIGLREAVPPPPAAAADSIGINRWEKVRVEIFNQLTNNADFTIHCKSADDDLGTQVVGVGHSYGFSFTVNFFETTLFFCGISWPNRQTTFDIYAAQRDMSRCPHYCMWQVTDDFILGFTQYDQDNPDIVISWE